ncbi:hypothetical protein J437_LFUL012160 [Ladona fulva]|uniref:Nascent polypeptide-associated complex subunit alpha-like UBA domain-containing protein n=1 Tax=Ladona fulva TaxID=123851 RepID=A0A8K0KF49_LADFU|nr:hypothetical protein J437_LFUL012160 [Ladona fulva]
MLRTQLKCLIRPIDRTEVHISICIRRICTRINDTSMADGEGKGNPGKNMKREKDKEKVCRSENAVTDSEKVNDVTKEKEVSSSDALSGGIDGESQNTNMGDDECIGDIGRDIKQEKGFKKAAKYDSGAADLEKVTDYAEEKEISASDALTGAMTLIGDRRNKEAAEKMAKERELLKVSIKKEDVELIVKEMEIPRSKAEHTLREHHGNIVEALIALTN